MPRRRLLLAALAAVLMAAGAALFVWRPWTRGGGVPGPAAAAATASPPTPPNAARLSAAQPPRRGPQAGTRPVEGTTPDGESAMETAPSAGVGIVVPCRVRYQDGSDASGEVRLLLVAGEQRDVVAAGRAEKGGLVVRASQEGTFHVARLLIDYEEYGLPLPDVVVASGKPITLVIGRRQPATILVVDAATGAPIADARAYRFREDGLAGVPAFEEPFQIPHPKTVAGPRFESDSSGSITLPPAWGSTPVYVTAPGRAWRSVSVPHIGSEPLRVELGPGGSIVIDVSGWGSLGLPRLDLRSGERHDVELPVGESEPPFTFDGIPTGSYVARLRQRPVYGSGRVYGTAALHVGPGETSRITVTVEPERVRRQAPVRGVLHVPAAWDAGAIAVILVSLGSTEQEGGQDGVTQRKASIETREGERTPFEFEPVPPGAYVIYVRPMGWATIVEVPLAGATLDLSVPEPCSVEVRAVDAQSGDTISKAGLDWRWPVEGAWDPQREHGPASDLLRFRAPRGSVTVVVFAEGYESETITIEAVPGPVIRRDVRLKMAASISVRVRLDGTPIRFSPAWHVVLEPLEAPDGDGTEQMSTDDEEATEPGLKPGRWKVSMKDAAGFEPVPPKEVALEAGKTTDVVFDLVRKK